MAEAHPSSSSFSQEQIVLGKVISSIAKNGGKPLSSEDLGIIKHIISPEDFEILRQNFAVTRFFYNGDDKNLPFSLMQSFSNIPGVIDVEGDRLSREFKYEALMGLIENIFHHALLNDKPTSQQNFLVSNEKIDGGLRSIEGLQIDSNIQRTVHELYWKMISKCECGVDDAHEVTITLLDSIRDYSWAAQVVLLVVAFAINFGEFWQTLKPPLTTEGDHLSPSSHCLIQVTDFVKSSLESVRTLVERIWDLTKWLVAFEKEFATSWYATYKKSNAAIQYPEVLVIGYQVVYSVVTCLFHNIALVKMNKEYTTVATEFQQMSKSSERLALLHSYVSARRRKYAICLHLQPSIYTGPCYLNILKFMSELISKTGELVLSHATTKGKVTLKKLTGKCIALFISDFKVQKEEFPSLIKTYNAALNNPNTCFEVVWVPMVDQSTTWTVDNKRTVSKMGASMPWYWVSDPSTIKISFLQHVKEEWHFQGKPILVIFGGSQIKHTNALPMMEFWGPSAYPFSIKDEEHLQEGLSRAIDLMFSTNEPNMDKWVGEGKIICFYGSHNEDWIRRFLHKIDFIAMQSNFEMEITYVGTNKKEEELSRILTIVKDMNKSRVWPEEKILSFWHTWKKIRRPKKIYFAMWKEVINILSYDEHEDGWAIIFQDSKQEVVKSSGTKLIECLDSFATRGSIIEEPKDFLKGINEELRVKYVAEHCCNGVKVPTSDGPIQVHCMECGRFMD